MSVSFHPIDPLSKEDLQILEMFKKHTEKRMIALDILDAFTSTRDAALQVFHEQTGYKRIFNLTKNLAIGVPKGIVQALPPMVSLIYLEASECCSAKTVVAVTAFTVSIIAGVTLYQQS